MSNQMAVKLTKVTDAYFPMIQKQLENHMIAMDEYAKRCVIAAIGAINMALDVKGVDWADPQLDKSNVAHILMNVALLKLNATASPREVFFTVRNTQVTVKGENDKPQKVWRKQIEMGIEGDGNDALLARFGRGVENVCQIWYVREDDHFEYPKFDGLQMTPPKWSPTGSGNVVRVVYPITKTNGMIEYHISERKDVAKNLIAHINNNLMNETFGICEDRYKATADQKAKIKAKKDEVLKKAKELGLDALDDPVLQKWISPAWTDEHSRESMIIRKMRNNVVKKIPKDFGSSIAENAFNEISDDTQREVNREVAENANGEMLDIEYTVVGDTPGPEPAQPEAAATKEEPPAPEPQAPDSQMSIGDQFEAYQQQQQASAQGGPGF